MLSHVGTRLLSLIEQSGYRGISFAMFLENIFPPIPSELIMPFGGFLAGQGKLDLRLVILSGIVGTYLGVLPFYLIGRWLHKEKVLRWTDRRGKYLGISRDEIQKAFDAFDKRGYPFVLVGRFIPLFRTIISFPAGATRMNFRWYSLYTIIGSAVRTALLAYIGYILGDHWDRIGSVLSEYEHVILALIALFIVWFFGRKIVRRKGIMKNE